MTLIEKIKKTKENIETRLQKIIKNKEIREIIQDKIITIRESRYVIPIRKDFKGRFKGMIIAISSS